MKLPEIEINVKFKNNVKRAELFKITSSVDASKCFREIFNADTINWTEESIILCLNRANQVIGFHKTSSGGTTGTIMDAKVIFTIALKSMAQGLIIAHNHPSGQLKPSEADIKITKSLKEAGKLLDIPIMDHLIMTDEGYYSMADNGYII
jgi:DNA repair protein RadC